MATIFGDDVTDLQQCIKYTSSCTEGQRLSTEGKIEIIRGGSINPNNPTPAPLPSRPIVPRQEP